MGKILIGILSVILLVGLASAANSFGEVASLNACHCLVFNSTNDTNVWTLYSGFNTSLQFYIVKPNLTDVKITTSVINGTIKPDSYYQINVTVVSNSPVNQSGYLSAYTIGNATKSGSASVRLGVNKLIEVAANTMVASLTSQQQVSSSNQGTGGSTTAGSTTIKSTQNQSTSKQSGTVNSAATTATIPSYLIVIVIVLFVVICGMASYIVVKGKKSNSTKSKKTNPKRKRK